MSPDQKERCLAILKELTPSELHHGDAIGADAQIHDMADALTIPVIVHPPLKPTHRAFCRGREVRAEMDFMARNRAIVNETDLLLATPAAPATEASKAGTWRTVRYARRAGKLILVVLPDGTVVKSGKVD